MLSAVSHWRFVTWLIGHFWLNRCLKTSPVTKPFILKWVWFVWKNFFWFPWTWTCRRKAWLAYSQVPYPCLAYIRLDKSIQTENNDVKCNISKTRHGVSSHLRTSKRELKTRQSAEYVWRSSRCLMKHSKIVVWWNTQKSPFKLVSPFEIVILVTLSVFSYSF